MHGRIITPVFALLSGLLAMPAVADQTALERGRELASTCMGCHGVPSYTNVYPSYHVPKLGGQHQLYLEAALKAYRSGERNHPTMQAQSVRLTDTEIQEIAAYFASIKP